MDGVLLCLLPASARNRELLHQDLGEQGVSSHASPEQPASVGTSIQAVDGIQDNDGGLRFLSVYYVPVSIQSTLHV